MTFQQCDRARERTTNNNNKASLNRIEVQGTHIAHLETKLAQNIHSLNKY